MDIPEIRAELKILSDNYASMPPEKFDARVELVENVLPLFAMFLDKTESLDEEVADQGDAIDGMIDQTEDLLHPETAEKFAAVLALARAISAELEAALPKLDDVTKKRVRPMLKAYRQGHEVLAALLMEITLVDDPETEDNAAAGPDDDADVGGLDAELDDDALEGDA